MSLTGRANVVVIGGGIFGTSAAFHLARGGQKDVILLDQGPIAGGTTPFAAGQTGYLNIKKDALSFSRYCIEFFENFENETGYPIDFKQNGSIRITVSDRNRPDLDAMAAIAAEFGDPVEFLTPDRLRKLVPGLQLSEAAGILHVSARRLHRAQGPGRRLRGRCARSRSRDIYHTPVIGLDLANGRVRSVQTANRSIECNWVVLAGRGLDAQYRA